MTKEPFNLNLNALLEEIYALAEKKPDFVYNKQEGSNGTCSYVGAHTGSIGGQACIVGQALMNLGVPEQSLRDWENAKRERGIANTAHVLLADEDMFTLEGSGDITASVSYIQVEQDCGNPWAEAVERQRKAFAMRDATV